MNSTDPNRAYLIGGAIPSALLGAGIVGGKAANLVRLHRLGLAVPPALALTTDLARRFMERGALPEGFRTTLPQAVAELEAATRFAVGRGPLIVSVRSSPPASMPGMLGTILNVGMSEQTASALIRERGNPWLAWDAYRRFVVSFAAGVYGCPLAPFETLTADALRSAGAETVQDLDPISMRDLARAMAALLRSTHAAGIPADPMAQIAAAVEAVLQSWTSPWACEYRRLNGLDDATGTGVLLQAMVFGNSGPLSGSGVGFTRNPATGEPEMYVDFVFNAQGGDVVSGRLPVVDSHRLPAVLPAVWTQLRSARSVLEREFLDMQDLEFTVDGGRLFFLQARAGKRTPLAALRIATDLVREGVLDESAGLKRLATCDLAAVERVVVRPGPHDDPIARATPASVGAVTGRIVFDAERAKARATDGPIVLVRTELATDDIAGLAVAGGVLTTFGGRTSHAAVVARQLGKVCLVGCADLQVNEPARMCALGGHQLREGDEITLDGETGLVYLGTVPVVHETPDAALALVERWRGRQPPPENRQAALATAPTG